MPYSGRHKDPVVRLEHEALQLLRRLPFYTFEPNAPPKALPTPDYYDHWPVRLGLPQADSPTTLIQAHPSLVDAW